MWRRVTARVLPVNAEGRVLLLRGIDPARPGDPFWFTIGGGVEGSESLAQAAARELAEEAGIVVDPADLGESVQESVADFHWSGIHFVQDQAFFAIAAGDVEVSFAGQEALERATTLGHGWLLPQDLEGSAERPADPGLPHVMRLAVAAVRGRAPAPPQPPPALPGPAPQAS